MPYMGRSHTRDYNSGVRKFYSQKKLLSVKNNVLTIEVG